MAAPKFNQYMIDEVLLSNDASLRDVLAFGMVMLVLLQVGLTHLRGKTLNRLSVELNLQWVSDVFGRMMHLPMGWFEKRQLGDVLSRFGSVGPIQDLITTRAIGAVLDGLMAALTLTMMLLYSPLLAAVVVATVALYALVRALSYRPLREAGLEGMALAAREQSCLLETVRAIGPIKLFGRELARRSHWMALRCDTVNRTLRTQLMTLWFGNLDHAIGAVSAALVMWLGAGLVMQGSFTVGMLFALSAYSGQFYGRMGSLINLFVDYRMLSLHCERLADIVLEPAEADGPQARSAAHLVARIELVGVGFRYSDGEPWLLRGVNLAFEPDESVAITGPSGCGKTTLIKLILGSLRPTEGVIRYGGVAVDQLGVRAYRAYLAAVMQDDVLLAGSLGDNISFFAEQPDHDRIEACARMAAVHDDIGRMMMGYETLLSDMGSNLSGGQRQRVLLARALYKDPKVLILDEATSALDVEQERLVSAAIGALPMTRIMIAHRPETIASAARVVVLQGGQVAHDVRRALTTACRPC